MDLNLFIIGVFCLTDDWMSSQGPVRQRGPSPKLSDSEVITMEIVAEFLGIDTEKGIHTYFGRHYPRIREVHRTTFARQAANLWKIKERMYQHGSTPLNRGHAARAASTSHFGLLPRHLGISVGGTHKLINSSTDQR